MSSMNSVITSCAVLGVSQKTMVTVRPMAFELSQVNSDWGFELDINPVSHAAG
jgi:hypothetical protein